MAVPPNKRRATTVSHRNGQRISKLENRVCSVEEKLEQIGTDTAQILGVLTTTRSVAGFARKYGVRTLTFGAGIFTAAGIGNPKIWAAIGAFFGTH